jgi:uncharacterized protein|eukprot:g2317.t1
MSSKFAEEASKPADASDLGSREAAIDEVKRLRQMFKEVSTGSAEAAPAEAKKPLLPAEKRTPALRFEAAAAGDLAKLAKMLVGSTQEELDAVNEDDETMVHLAAANGKADCVQALVNAGANLNLTDDFGKSAIRLAVGAPKNKIGQGHYDCVKILLEGKADPDVICDYGWTALHKACEMGYTEAVKILIAGGSDVNKKEKGGETPLDKCTEKEHADCVELIKAAGGQPGGD